MDQTPKYLVAIMLHGDARDRLEMLRRTHRIPAWGGGLELHATLVRPFRTESSLSAIVGRLTEIALRAEPFTMELAGLGRFDNQCSVLYVPVTPLPALMRLQQGLARALTDLVPPAKWSYRPHVTISDETTQARIDEYMARTGGEFIRMDMHCDRFSLLRKDNRWRVACDIPLGSR